jgi:TatA/E family protein of Tat protein translocase
VFGIEGFKLAIILVAGMLLIGPDKLPEIARTIGKFIKMFNAAREEMEKTIKADMFASEETAKVFTQTGESLTATLYNKPTVDDEDEEEEEE